MEIHGDFDSGDGVGAVENAAAVLHVEELDGENIGGGAQLFGREKEGSGLVLVFAPPVDDRRDASQFASGDRAQDAQNVEVGVAFLVVAAGGGAVENHGL